MELYNIGTHNADSSFRSGYLNRLERMLFAKMPNHGLKAKPHVESCIRTPKIDCSIVYNMVYGDQLAGLDGI